MSNTPSELITALINSNKHFRIKLLGDSITHGVGGTGFQQNGEHIVTQFSRNPDGYCWSNNFKKYMEANYDCEIVINACTGTKIEFVIEHFDTLVDKEDDLIICTIGTNNRHRYFKECPDGKPTREEIGKDFYQKILTLHDMLKKTGKPFIFVANIPAGERNERDGVDFWRILHMDDINAMYKHAAKALDFPFISMYELFSAYYTENNIPLNDLLVDCLHPNDRGYDIMYNLMMGALGLR